MSPATPPVPIPDSSPGMQIVHLLRAVTVSLDAFGARFAAANGLHPTDLRAIVDLLDAERADVTATPGWLGERRNLNSASVTALVDRLERAGHVRREPHPRDRRSVRLVVSPEAKTLGWAFFGPLMARVVGMLDGYGETELAVIHRFLSETAGIVATATAPDPGWAGNARRPRPPTR